MENHTPYIVSSSFVSSSLSHKFFDGDEIFYCTVSHIDSWYDANKSPI